MIELLPCHHFHAQHVLPIDDEPTAICGAGDRLFVALNTCFIKQFIVSKTTAEDGYKLFSSFPSVDRVQQMAYSEAGDFLVTIEFVASRHPAPEHRSSGSVRVYTNLHAEVEDNAPLRATVAGQRASLRLEHQDSVGSGADHLSVIEIPLKNNAAPRCAAVSRSTCSLAVGLQTRVLLYGVCCKKVDIAGSRRIYRDVKCLLELEFAFKILQLDICEEFLICCSTTECQAVQMNFGKTGLTDSSSESQLVSSSSSSNNSLPLGETEEECCNCQFCEDSDSSHTAKTSKSGRPSFGVKKNDVKTVAAAAQTHPPNVDSKRVCVVRPMASADSAAQSAETDVLAATCKHLLRSGQVNVQQDFVRVRATASVSQVKTGGTVEDLLAGPVEGSKSPCPVSVEFEGNCGHDSALSGVLDNGLITWLYKKYYGYRQSTIVGVQLIPVYADEGGKSRGQKRANRFISRRRSQLIGLFCFVSTSSCGQLFSLLSGVQLVSSYYYSTEINRAVVSADRLFATSPECLDVYTCHCINYLGCKIAPKQRESLLSTEAIEPCLVGRHKFLGLDTICHIDGHIALMSKLAGLQGLEDDCWNVYVLTCPEAVEFNAEIVELAESYKATNSAAHDRLMSTSQLVLGGTMFLQQFIDKSRRAVNAVPKFTYQSVNESYDVYLQWRATGVSPADTTEIPPQSSAQDVHAISPLMEYEFGPDYFKTLYAYEAVQRAVSAVESPGNSTNVTDVSKTIGEEGEILRGSKGGLEEAVGLRSVEVDKTVGEQAAGNIPFSAQSIVTEMSTGSVEETELPEGDAFVSLVTSEQVAMDTCNPDVSEMPSAAANVVQDTPAVSAVSLDSSLDIQVGSEDQSGHVSIDGSGQNLSKPCVNVSEDKSIASPDGKSDPVDKSVVVEENSCIKPVEPVPAESESLPMSQPLVSSDSETIRQELPVASAEDSEPIITTSVDASGSVQKDDVKCFPVCQSVASANSDDIQRTEPVVILSEDSKSIPLVNSDMTYESQPIVSVSSNSVARDNSTISGVRVPSNENIASVDSEPVPLEESGGFMENPFPVEQQMEEHVVTLDKESIPLAYPNVSVDTSVRDGCPVVSLNSESVSVPVSVDTSVRDGCPAVSLDSESVSVPVSVDTSVQDGCPAVSLDSESVSVPVSVDTSVRDGCPVVSLNSESVSVPVLVDTSVPENLPADPLESISVDKIDVSVDSSVPTDQPIVSTADRETVSRDSPETSVDLSFRAHRPVASCDGESLPSDEHAITSADISVDKSDS